MTHSTFSVGITDPTVKNGNPLRAMLHYFTAAAIQCPLCAHGGRRLNQEFQSALPVEKLDLVEGLARLVEEQHEPQAIGQIGVAGEINL